MKENPKDRIFNDKVKEEFLPLKNLILCKYTYNVKFIGKENELDSVTLKQDMLSNLTKVKDVQIE